MPKSKVVSAKSKKNPTKYSKLLLVASKELETTKKSLVSAERTLQKAKQRHEELIAEVARLDMVQRSLKALVEGTEPPTNVKYVYNYPQWVWQPVYTYPYIQTQPYIYSQPYWGVGNWNLTTGQNTMGVTAGSTVTCGAQTFNTAGTFTNTSGGIDNGVLGSNATMPSSATLATAYLTNGAGGGETITVDLSTGATDPTATMLNGDVEFTISGDVLASAISN